MPIPIPIAPGEWLGLLGGGQLGRMFAMAAQSLGFRVAVLDPGSDGPAAAVADRHIHADYLDPAGLARLAGLVRAATTEFENVPADALEYLARQCRVTPSAASVAIAQDRISETTFLAGHGVAVAPFAVIRTRHDACGIDRDRALVPGIVKSARLGYDGKGQRRVTEAAEVLAAFESLGGVPCVLERFIDLACEISVIVARRGRGDAVTWPVAENLHRDGILDVSIVPARVAPHLAQRARDIALGIADALDYRGVLCVEMFVARDGTILCNEIAPRPHNSGHWTIDASITSQFEQQVRVLADLPLGRTDAHSAAVMVNVLGDVWWAGNAGDNGGAQAPEWARVLAIPGAKLHLYGKSDARHGRKMGHVTCVAATQGEAIAAARAVKRVLGIPGADVL
ncbi:MAG: 5-(carboxyamino)imidazole ribonucleotide synthase [Burkholderiales bacterium]